jgi:hypothetical protein
MSFSPFHALKNEAEHEAYIYFDQKIRLLPKNKDGSFNFSATEFNDNDVDAFRHAYVSGVFTQEYGDRTADFLGLMNEYSPEGQYSHSVDPRSRNMDLWNNRVGRKYGKKTSGRKTLLKLIRGALKKGELIVDPSDSREFSGSTKIPKRISKPVIALSQSSTGRNQTYYDLQKRTVMTLNEFVALIGSGIYPAGYSVKQIKGIETPVSKRDQKKKNNIE